MVGLSIYGLSVHGINKLTDTCYIFLTINFLTVPHSSCYNFYVIFRLKCYILFTDIPGLNHHEKVSCENCGKETTKSNIVRHKTKCSAGSVTCPSGTKLLTKSKAELNYHIVSKHSKATVRVVHKGKIFNKDFHCFYLLREH